MTCRSLSCVRSAARPRSIFSILMPAGSVKGNCLALICEPFDSFVKFLAVDCDARAPRNWNRFGPVLKRASTVIPGIRDHRADSGLLDRVPDDKSYLFTMLTCPKQSVHYNMKKHYFVYKSVLKYAAGTFCWYTAGVQCLY